MIEIKKLHKSFSTWESQVEIFSDLNIILEESSFTCLIGPSGSWKSTFLNLLSGIDCEYDGDILLGWENIRNFSQEQMTQFRWKNTSYIFQNFKLIENLTVGENIDLVVELNHLDRNFSTIEILEIVWLKDKIDTYVFNLSWGESQRVAIARAFIGKTKILFADEPTGALDIDNKKIIMELILQLHKKTHNTIVLITHDDEVARLWDTVYKISQWSLKKISK